MIYSDLLYLHLRDFRKCADLYLQAWGLAPTGDATKDAVHMIPEGVKIRVNLKRIELSRLSMLAASLIHLGHYDEVDETLQYHRGTREAENSICVEAVNSIQDRIGADAGAEGEATLHLLVEALLDQKKTAPARRLLKKLEGMSVFCRAEIISSFSATAGHDSRPSASVLSIPVVVHQKYFLAVHSSDEQL